VTENDEMFLDGNAAAGALLDVFNIDLTVAEGKCDHCGRVAMLAEARVYDPVHGMIFRCSGCDGILMRLVMHDSRVWMDLRGLTYVELDRSPRTTG